MTRIEKRGEERLSLLSSSIRVIRVIRGSLLNALERNLDLVEGLFA